MAHLYVRSIRVAERLALPTSGHGVAGSNPAGGEILPEPKRRFIAQSFSCSSFHRLEVTEILLKGRKTLTHPSIHPSIYMFFEMRSDLGTLDSGERSLPFGLLVLYVFLLLYIEPFHENRDLELCGMKSFKCACPATQNVQGCGSLSEASSKSLYCVSKQRSLWRDYADAQV